MVCISPYPGDHQSSSLCGKFCNVCTAAWSSLQCQKKQKKIMYICMYVVSDTEHTVAKNIWANVWWQNTGWLLKHNANSDTTLTHICNISKVASKALLFTRVKTAVVCMYVCMYLICQMQTTDKATTKQCTHWQDSEAQHALTTALDKKNKHHKHFQNQNST